MDCSYSLTVLHTSLTIKAHQKISVMTGLLIVKIQEVLALLHPPNVSRLLVLCLVDLVVLIVGLHMEMIGIIGLDLIVGLHMEMIGIIGLDLINHLEIRMKMSSSIQNTLNM